MDIWEDAFDIGRHTGKTSQEYAGIDLGLLKTLKVLLQGKKALEEDRVSVSNTDIDFMLATLLRRILSNRERDYSTTVTEDLKLLESTTLQPRRSMAIQVRLGEKEILAEMSHHLGLRLATLTEKAGAKAQKKREKTEHRSHSAKKKKK